jgi:formate-dependent nitrite reductase membrane component NrfD
MFKGWRPVDWIVVGIAAAICVMLLVIVVGVWATDRTLAQSAQEMIGAVVTAMVAIISIYVGACLRRHDDDDSKK